MICPNCGYCPECGRPAQQAIPIPVWPNTTPYWPPMFPVITSSGTTSGNVVIKEAK